MKFTMMVQAVLVAFCLGLPGLPFLMAQTSPVGQSGLSASKKPIFIPEAQLRLRNQKYWMSQRKDFNALTDDTWAHERWTSNDAPYVLLQSQIEQAFARDEQPQVLVARYEATAKSEPNNPLVQFGWAYTVRLAIKFPSFHVKDTQDLLASVNVALAETPSPHTYAYDHLRYLIWLQWGGGGASHFLKDMAYRLLEKDPKDFPVLMGLAGIYTQNRDATAQQKGYALIQKMTKDYPNKPEVYDLLGCWYYFQYLSYRDPINYHLAMNTYQKALGMYPPQSTRREGLRQAMAFLTTRYRQMNAGGP